MRSGSSEEPVAVAGREASVALTWVALVEMDRSG